MGTIFLDPNSNNNTLWSQNAYTLIDDGVRFNNSPGVGDAIIADENDDFENQAYNMSTDTLPAGFFVSTVTLYAWGSINGDAGTPFGDINWAGCDEKSLVFISTPAWHSVSWTGLEVTSQATIDGTIMYLNSKVCNQAKVPNIIIEAAYLVLITEALPPEGPANIAKWNGVPVANLAKWNGVNWSDLVKYNGVD